MEQHTLGAFTWVHLEAPDSDELTVLRDDLELPAFVLEIASRPHHRPRFESYAGHLLLVLKPATYDEQGEAVRVDQLVVLADAKVVVTIGADHHGWLADIRRRLDADPAQTEQGPATLVHAIVARTVDGYTAVLDGLDNDVDEIETQVFSTGRGSHAERIYRLKSEVQEFRRATEPLPDELAELLAARDLAEWLTTLADEFGDVRVRAVRAADHVDHLDALLNSVLSAHLAQIGIQQNSDMRRISAWVAIVAAPTAIAAIYGMNFEFMPELEWRYGYFLVLAVMASICLLLYRMFKRSGWL